MVTSGRRPLRTLFVLTSMPVGGAETLLANLIAQLDRSRIEPEICCLKQPGPMGEQLSRHVPLHAELIRHKFDLRVVPRLASLLRSRKIDSLVTVGAGDKMFWGRLAAHFVGTPVVISALHSTGWPDGLGWLNRQLTSWTDAFVAVAKTHGEYLVHQEGLPADKVVTIPNGIDTDRFRPQAELRDPVRAELGIPKTAPTVIVVAALRPEKNHARVLRVSARVLRSCPDTQFLIVGEGPCQVELESLARQLGVSGQVRLLGNRDDIPRLLAASDLFLLTSDNEANPVSILEAMSCGLPIVATAVGSIHEMVTHGEHGFLAPLPQEEQLAEYVIRLIGDDPMRGRMQVGNRRKVIRDGSLDRMVEGYTNLLESTYARKAHKALPRGVKRRPDAAAWGAVSGTNR